MTVQETPVEELTRSFNHKSVEQMEYPYELFERFRNECPVGHSDEFGGFWFATRYNDITKVLRNFRAFSNADSVGIPRTANFPMYPLDLDPPMHTDFKNVISPLLHVTKAEAMAPAVEEAVNNFIDGFIADGRVDLVNLADFIPSSFAISMIGIPDTDRRSLVDLVHGIVHFDPARPEVVAAAARQLDDYVLEFVRKRRQEPSQGHVIDAFFEIDIPSMGGKLNDEQVKGAVNLFIFGGLHTTRSAILESLYYLANNPDVRQKVIDNLDDAAFWVVAVEEFIRYSTPTQNLKRKVTCPVEVGGKQLGAGDNIMMCFGSANRDESKFANADQVVLDRTPNPHLAFGMGPHRCIGQNLARVFLRCTIRGVLNRMPDYQVEPGFVPHYEVGEGRTMINLPVTFTPSEPRVPQVQRAAE